MGVKKEVLVYLSSSHVKAWDFLPFHRELLEESVPGLKVTVCQNSKEFLDLFKNLKKYLTFGL